MRPELVLAASLSVLLLTKCGGSARLGEDNADTMIVATYGDQVVYQSEFLREFERSASLDVSDAADTHEDFLERYVNYRLKVLAAEEAGYARNPALLSEIHAYRASFARPYLLDREVLAPILLDFYDKKKQFVHASHIFVQLRPDMSAADTLRAYALAQSLRDSVTQGMPFAEVAMLYSEDLSAATPTAPQGYRGDLGWFTAGMMIKPFEDRAYNEPIGQVSEVFRSDYGYHVLLVHEREPAVPNIRLSQILIRINGTAPESLLVARNRIETAKARLDAGQNFAYVAGELSEESGSRSRGGDVGSIRYLTRGIDSTFRAAAFSIPAVGDVTDILRTGYGFQILKLTGRDTLGTYEDEYENLKRETRNLPRLLKAEEALAHEARNRYSTSMDTVALTSLVAGLPRDSVRIHFDTIAADDSLADMVIGRVADSIYTVRQLGRFAADRNNRIRNGQTTREEAISVGNAFLDYAAITHTALDLEHEDEEFAQIMHNFRDGLLLFQLMEDSVWTAANKDSLGLENFYEANRDRYRFEDRHRILEVFAYDDSLHEAAVHKLDGGMSWHDFYDHVHADSLNTIRLDTVFVEGPSRSIYDRALGLKPGTRSDIIPYRNGFMTLYYDGVEPARPKTFEEALAEVISEYQSKLEERLIARLRAKYGVTTYPARAIRAMRDS